MPSVRRSRRRRTVPSGPEADCAEPDERGRARDEDDRAVRRPHGHARGDATVPVGGEVFDPAHRAVARRQPENRGVGAGRPLHVALQVHGAERVLVEAGRLEAGSDVGPVDVERRLAGGADHVHRLGGRDQGVRIAAGQCTPGLADGRRGPGPQCAAGVSRGGHRSELPEVDLGARERMALDLGGGNRAASQLLGADTVARQREGRVARAPHRDDQRDDRDDQCR